MELFHNAKAIRLKNVHNKYLTAEEDEESVTQDRNGAAKNAKWSVEFVEEDSQNNIIRLKSCYNKYLTASNQPFLLGMTGRKVIQSVPERVDSSVEWEPIKEGNNQVKLKTRYGQYLRANGGLPPWRNSITHDIPHRTSTQDWLLWDVDVMDIIVRSPAPKPPPPLIPRSDSNSPARAPARLSRQESEDGLVTLPPKINAGRVIYYQIANENGEIKGGFEGACITFKGNSVQELTQRLQEETCLEDTVVCTKSPLNDNLYPLRLQLPPNNAAMHVVVVPSSSKALGRDSVKNAIT